MVDITEAQMVAAQLTNNGSSRYMGSLHATSVRLPPFQIAQVEAIAKRLNKSRNAAFSMVVASGFEAICIALGEDADALLQEVSEIQLDGVNDAAGEL